MTPLQRRSAAARKGARTRKLMAVLRETSQGAPQTDSTTAISATIAKPISALRPRRSKPVTMRTSAAVLFLADTADNSPGQEDASDLTSCPGDFPSQAQAREP